MGKTNNQKQLKNGNGRPRVPDVALICEQVEKFQQVEPSYQELAKVLEAILRKAEKQYAPLAIVQTRAKKVDSFAEKITRKWDGLDTDDPVTEFTDLCGGRIITLLKSHSDAVCRFIEDHFDIDWDNCVNAIERLDTAEFGYLSKHYIVSLKPGVFTAKELGLTKIPDSVYPSEGCPMKAEIQVRTILEHAFADVTHDLCYKSSFKVPKKWLRQVGAVAAALETTSNEMEDIVAGIQDYAANFGGTLTKDETDLEIEKLEIILKSTKDKVKFALRIALLAITKGDWDKAIDTLEPYINMNNPAVWRDYGVALVKKNRGGKKPSDEYKKGHDYLKKAAEFRPGDSNAMAAYASSWRRFKTKKAMEEVRYWYHKAYETDPDNAYALANVLELEITHRKDLSAVALMRPAIERAIRRGLAQAEVGTNHPWAYYNAALFSALLGRECESLGYLAKAMACSNARFMLESACRSATRIENAVADRVILG
ncbi:MAG: hypothetical protein JW963_19315, partial [Anaerolineales bacterium]|nr:hypothetical protein [Anaerolineales bacterium]